MGDVAAGTPGKAGRGLPTRRCSENPERPGRKAELVTHQAAGPRAPAGQQGTPPAPGFCLRSAATPGLVFTFRSSRDHLSHLRGAQGAHLSPGGRHSKPSGKWQIVSPPTLSLGRSALRPRNPVSSMDPRALEGCSEIRPHRSSHARTNPGCRASPTESGRSSRQTCARHCLCRKSDVSFRL